MPKTLSEEIDLPHVAPDNARRAAEGESAQLGPPQRLARVALNAATAPRSCLERHACATLTLSGGPFSAQEPSRKGSVTMIRRRVGAHLGVKMPRTATSRLGARSN